MQNSLKHLPESKQTEILNILSIIKEEANPEKVILFGSHASKSWVEDEYIEEGIRYSYFSDYDFLVVIKKNGEKEQSIISHIENRTRQYKNAVSPIVHDIDYINEGLRFGQYFFTDIIRDGVLLFDTGRYQFADPVILTPREEREKAQRYFDIWFPRAEGFLKLAKYCLKEGDLKLGVFQLHQATECLLNTVLLVFTGYKPKTHNLQKLRNYAKYISSDLDNVFSSSDRDEKRLFDLLKRGYIDARYKLEYNISDTDLNMLVLKVEYMRNHVEKICEEKIHSY